MFDYSQFTELQKVTQALAKSCRATRSSCWSPNSDNLTPKCNMLFFIPLCIVLHAFKGILGFTIGLQRDCVIILHTSQRGTSYFNFVKSGISILRRKFSREKLLRLSHPPLVSLLIYLYFQRLLHIRYF